MGGRGSSMGGKGAGGGGGLTPSKLQQYINQRGGGQGGGSNKRQPMPKSRVTPAQLAEFMKTGEITTPSETKKKGKAPKVTPALLKKVIAEKKK